jgi:large subunit ribosomal protein L7/L12
MSKVQGLLSEIKGLSIVEVLELVEALQTEFGVSAAVAPIAAAGEATTGSGAAVEKTIFKVELIEAGTEKTKVIKALRVVKKELGLIEAKNATENLPYLVLAEGNKEDSENAKKLLEEAGAKVKVS